MTLRKIARALASSSIALGVGLCVAPASASPRNPLQETEIDREVSAVDPALVAKLHSANDAIDRGDVATAVRAYGEVHAKAPDVAAVTRRLCTTEARSGDTQNAVSHCREAVKKQPEAGENHAALANVLLALPDAAGSALEARDEANEAERLSPDTEVSQTTMCAVAARHGDTHTLEICSKRLRAIAPSSPQTHFFTALSLVNKRDTDGAERELDAARAAGLDDAAYTKMHAQLEDMRPKPSLIARGAPIVTTIAAAWAGLMFVLVVLGLLLGDGATRSPSKFSRSLYRGLLVTAWAMFPVTGLLASVVLIASLVLVALLFLALVGATHVIEAVFGVVALYVVIALVRSLFWRVPRAERGARVDLKKEKDLRSKLEAIAKRLRMEPIDEVVAEPGASIEVAEEGGVWRHLRGTSKRTLVIGVGALDGLSLRAFEALVASELARFRSRDSAGGDIAIIERAALDGLAERMEARGIATIANPAWWFVSIYRGFFERISAGAVEHQEGLADLRAAKAYGGAALVGGIRHVTERRVELEARAATSILEALERDEPPEDVYAKAPSDDLRQATADALEEIRDRESRIEALREEGYEEADDADAAAWSLFTNREALERKMNERLRRALRERIGLGQSSKESTVARA